MVVGPTSFYALMYCVLWKMTLCEILFCRGQVYEITVYSEVTLSNLVYRLHWNVTSLYLRVILKEGVINPVIRFRTHIICHPYLPYRWQYIACKTSTFLKLDFFSGSCKSYCNDLLV
jgi:hypothetical protein